MKIFIKRIIIMVCILGIALISLFFSSEFISNYFVRIKMNSLNAPSKGSKLLVFAPHCDDEVLGCGELIKNTIKNGGEVKVVLVTNGDGFKSALELDYLNLRPKSRDYVHFGYLRQKETITALKLLGVEEKNIIFLGYPDGGIAFLWNSNWDDNEPFTSSYTQNNKSPYINSYSKNVLYTGQNIIKDISSIITDYGPTDIAFPHPNDRHPDHWATNAFVKYSLQKLNYKRNSELLYLVHRGDWPTPMKKDTNLYLVPPKKLIDIGTEWYALSMNSEDIAEKKNAISSYKTQVKTLGLLLSAFERKNELLGKYKDLKLTKANNKDENVIPNKYNKVISDPLKDILNLEISKGADISGIYLEASCNNNLNIFIEANGNIDDEIKYNLGLFFFYGDSIKRLNLQIESNNILAKKISEESILDIKGIKVLSNKSLLHIIIPVEIVGDYKSIYINASTSMEEHLMDKTAWRMINK